VLVPNGASKAVVASLRSLTRRGDYCELASESRRRRGRSVYVRNVRWLPSAGRGSEQFVLSLLELFRARPYDVLLPFTTDGVYALSKHADAFPPDGPAFAVPPIESFLAVHDKERLTTLCERLGIPLPRSFVADEDHLADIASEIRYPAVVKARQSVGGGHGVQFARSRAELERAYREVTATRSLSVVEDFESPLVQEYLPGPVYDVCAVALEGKVVNLMIMCRVLMLPVAGGITAVGVTTRDPELETLARTLLEELSWHGPAELEFKHDPADGRYKLLEVNPRFWGTVDFAIRVGMDFPGMVRDYLLGEPVRGGLRYPLGVRYRYLFPRAVLAYIQLAREAGLREVRDPHRYTRTLYDFELADWPYELRRVAETARALRGRHYVPTSRVTASRLPTPARADWSRTG
jgi:predicted ATP-grasp superfamily ATP-dependent carboligase